MSEERPIITGMKRSLIIYDIMKVDDALLDLMRTGKQAVQIVPVPKKVELKESSEEWKGEEREEQGVNVETHVMIIYLEPVLQEEWENRVQANVTKIEDIK